MKPRNFPAKKLARRIRAAGLDPKEFRVEMEAARSTRTKKDRSARGKKKENL